MGKIRILPPELVNRIAAGEVVERPASVVKELVENAIDAGATRIEITATNGGRNLRIADNGCGLERDDLEVAFQNHATSKLQGDSDLSEILTLGFRGEALASIAAVAKVTCLSRTAEAEVGLKASVHPDGTVNLQETGCAPGTIMEVKELFYNVPVRLKFLKRPQTELSHIQEIVQFLALSHPEIGFKLALENNASVLKTSGSGDVLQCLKDVFDLEASERLLAFEMIDPDAGYRAWGYTSTPDETRSSKKWIHTFINGRAIRCHILGKAIEGAYSATMPHGRYPVTVLFLEMPPEEVDVNVHPTKKEVRYQQTNTLFSFVRRSVERALESFTLAARQPVAEMAESALSGPLPTQATLAMPSMPPTGSGRAAGPGAKPNYASMPPRQYERPQPPQPGMSHAARSLYQPPPQEMILPHRPEYRVIGQMTKTYILVEDDEGLMIVDQHIAAERMYFEIFSDQAERAEPVSQPLIVPMEFPVTPVICANLEDNRPHFERLGFAFQLESSRVCFSQVPSLYSGKVLKQSLESLLVHLENTGEVKLTFDDVLATAACHSAVRAGDVLHHEQMDRIIRQWMDCKRPWTCPHGRPVFHRLSHKEIMAFFDRPSLPVS